MISEPVRFRAGMLARNPFFCQQFKERVPPSYVTAEGARVRCWCGQRYELQVGELVECDTGPHKDGLLRTFLRTSESIRVAKWEPV